MNTEPSYAKKYKSNINIWGLHACFWNTWHLTLLSDDINLFVLVCKNGLTEANSSGILYFFQLKYVHVIKFLKYFKCMHYKHEPMNCIHMWYNIQQWRPYWIELHSYLLKPHICDLSLFLTTHWTWIPNIWNTIL